jgi:hypothetical protein
VSYPGTGATHILLAQRVTVKTTQVGVLPRT